MNIGIYAPDLDGERLGAPEYCLRQTIPHLREHFTVTLITHEQKSDQLYRKQSVVSSGFSEFSREISKENFDIIHFCGYGHRDIPLLISTPTVLAYHGDVQWVEPHLNYGDTPVKTSKRQRLIERAKLWQYDHVIYVSEDLRKRAVQRHCLYAPPSTTVHNGLDHEHYFPTSPDPIISKYQLEFPYIFHLSNFSRRKNPYRLIRAFGMVSDYCDVHFVIAGGGWRDHPEIRRLIDQVGLTDRISLLGYIPNKDLPQLYTGAEAFVFPSLHECFGLPVIEAMACSTTVIASQAYSIPEIAGEAAVYCNPGSTNSIAKNIEYVLKCTDARERYEQRGLERATNFSWKKRAGYLVDVYRSVLN